MLCDFYELTMGNGYYRNGFYKRNVYFDVFFRNVPDGGGFAIAAGLEQIVEYIQQLHFPMMILLICATREFSTRASSITSRTSSSTAIFTPSRKARPCSPANRC